MRRALCGFMLASLLIAISESVLCPAEPRQAARAESAPPAAEPLKIGWIGPMSGPTAKYGSYQAAILAQEDINRAGGINGRPLKLIFQDGKGSSREAVSAANFLINSEKVHYIAGGHCTPETLPASAIAEASKVIMMAAVTSSPKVSEAGDYIFRVTAVNTAGLDLLLPYAARHLSARRYAVLAEETDYALGLGEYFRDRAPQYGFEVLSLDSYPFGETDFRAVLSRIKQSGAEGIYISPQAPDSGAAIMRQMADLHMRPVVLANELMGNAVKANLQTAALFEGVLFHEPGFDREDEKTKAFILRFKERFAAADLPYGIWTAESYDAVSVLADTIARCGDNVELVKRCLYQTKNYRGVSGAISFDRHGDGLRSYTVKIVRNGRFDEVPVTDTPTPPNE